MSSAQNPKPEWGSTYRLMAVEKWKAKSAAMGKDATDALVAYARSHPGMKVLDLASGTGEPAISLAERIGPGGHVTALDLSAELLETAAERARQRALTNFSTQQADAHQLPFPDNSFDLVTCRFGVMFLDNRALQEAHRVLKLGARACFLAWGPRDQPFWSSTWGVVHKYAGGPLTAPGQDPFKYAQPGSLSGALRDAGFHQVEEETRTVPWRWPGTADEAWELSQSVATPFLPMLKRIPAEKWEQVNGEVIRAIQQYSEAGSINFGAVVVFASGVKGGSV